MAHNVETPALPGVDATWDRCSFGETTALATALVGALGVPPDRRRPGSFGMLGLLDEVGR